MINCVFIVKENQMPKRSLFPHLRWTGQRREGDARRRRFMLHRARGAFGWMPIPNSPASWVQNVPWMLTILACRAAASARSSALHASSQTARAALAARSSVRHFPMCSSPARFHDPSKQGRITCTPTPTHTRAHISTFLSYGRRRGRRKRGGRKRKGEEGGEGRRNKLP